MNRAECVAHLLEQHGFKCYDARERPSELWSDEMLVLTHDEDHSEYNVIGGRWKHTHKPAPVGQRRRPATSIERN